MLNILPKQIHSMYTRDGIKLDADVYVPDAKGKFPVLLMRQPYGREIASTVVYAHPTWYAAQGYIVVIQDVRGRGTSQGEFKLFANEIQDGEDTVNWAANLPYSNGKVGMYGFSYQGMTQLYAAAAKPPALKAICPAMIGYDLYSDWAYEGGGFCLQTNLAWALQLATETAQLKHDQQTYQQLATAARNLPLSDAIPNYPKILKDCALESFYHDWVTLPQSDTYWQQLSPKNYLQDVDLPMFHIGGWFDTYLRGTLNLYKAIAFRSKHRQQLVIGPWAHIPWGRKVGAIDFGLNAISPIDQMQIAWFDEYLKDGKTNLPDFPPIWLFEMGSNLWQGYEKLENKTHKKLFLSSTGLANIQEDNGVISSVLPNNYSCDVIVHDPWRPVPSLGGHAGIPAGVFERSHLDSRSDILTYTTPPLTEDLHLLGEVVVEVYCDADKPSFDLSAILSEVHSDGRVYNLTQGYLNCENGLNRTLRRIQLQTTCAKISQGNSLRLSLSAACFPAYAMNSGTGIEISKAKAIDSQIITITVHCGGEYPSQIHLPSEF
ncbi:CocE/NonD family hydrolase [Calothrix sp. PCC 6303]|uniref:CocE/NonD family hydrolase n=1 Tax=Calothrix sp. PCC 6303 TaxID=1170562 RepID=UPI0002A04616|nr:CocE/NonD family hydrolase [Calothrix sp. PCC 6303]AFY99194.1 hydrolase CocE/NonD family protein [Calothrix sp. PCC 6303]